MGALGGAPIVAFLCASVRVDLEHGVDGLLADGTVGLCRRDHQVAGHLDLGQQLTVVQRLVE